MTHKSTMIPIQANNDQMLRSIYLFARLSETQLARIKCNMHRLHLDEGEYLFEHGQAAERFFLVLNGHIKLLRLSPEGIEKVFEIIKPNETFAEAMMFMPNALYPVSAQAIGNTELLSFDSKTFVSLLKESMETCFFLMFEMSKRLRMWINEIDNLTLQNATYRLVNYLLYQLPEDAPNQGEISFQIPKHVIASRLSIKPETLSRILNTLTTEGLISVQGRTILLHDLNKLRAFSHSEMNTRYK